MESKHTPSCFSFRSVNPHSFPFFHFFNQFSVPPVPVLERTSSWSDVFSSEKVVLECRTTSSSELIFTWKKNGSSLGSSPNLSQSPDKSVLTITATSQDSGSYTCVVEGKKKPSQTKESGPVNIQVSGKFCCNICAVFIERV